MDAESAKTSFCSSITKVEEDGVWYGQLPCVCHSSRGCHQHNPTQELIYHNPRLLPKKSRPRPSCFYRIFSWLWSTLDPDWMTDSPPDISCGEELEPLRLFYTRLPFDAQSVGTLAPLHPSLPYHLAFYHLDCVRHQLKLASRHITLPRRLFIPELSCSGTSDFFHDRHTYTWSNEVYFEKGTFLQKQEIEYYVDEGSPYPAIPLTSCPHTTVKLQRPLFKDKDGFLEAKVWATVKTARQRSNWDGWWTSKAGRLASISACPTCHSDTEFTLDLLGRQIHIRLACYRDLGPATERSFPRWNSLLTGKGFPNRPYRYDTYKRVWYCAHKLGRPDLHLITFRFTSGEWSVMPDAHGE
jgi:hypothetical protein